MSNSSTIPKSPHIARRRSNTDPDSPECKIEGKKERIPAVNNSVIITAAVQSHHSRRSMRRRWLFVGISASPGGRPVIGSQKEAGLGLSIMFTVGAEEILRA